jgi:hypothetical protein
MVCLARPAYLPLKFHWYDVNIYLSNLENTAQPQSLSSTINQLILKALTLT